MNKFAKHFINFFAGAAVVLLSTFIFSSGILAAGGSYEIPVLMYHHLLPDSDNTLFRNDSVITPERFDEHMHYLYEQGYTTITLDELNDFLYNNKKITGKKVLITFDDGYASNYKYAYSILKKYNFNAVVFLITSKLGQYPEEFDPDKLNMFSLYEMEASKDVFEFGSHTNNMHKADESGAAFLVIKPDSEIRADIEMSFSYPLVKKVFAYPFGDFNRSNVKALKELGCKLAFSTRTANLTKYTDPYMIPRYTIPGSMQLSDFARIFEKVNN